MFFLASIIVLLFLLNIFSYYLQKTKFDLLTKNINNLFKGNDYKLENLSDLSLITKLIREKINEKNTEIKKIKEFGELFDLSKDYFEEGILFLDYKKNIKSINKRALDLFDKNNKNINSFSKLTDFTTNLEVLEFVENCITSRLNESNKFVQTNFPEKHFSLRAIKFNETIVLFIRDLTEIVTLDKTRKEFFANTSHELKTPVTSIQLNVEALKNSIKIDSKDDFDYFLEKITNDSNRLQKISKEIGDVHALESGSLPVDIKEFIIDDFILETKILIDTLLDSKKINLKITKKNKFKKVRLDRNLFKIVFENIFSNSIRYSKTGSSIELDLTKSNGQLEMIFKDFGTGVSENELTHIFERFYRTEGSRSDKHSGLGLSIVKQIVKIHEGKIFAKSSLNKGLSITIQIPQ
tara:strand:+ start:1083 stop:2309 length:1227 start_codon:yes stop_codon:yes gene_type:complete